jgi:nitronate monooxygenase
MPSTVEPATDLPHAESFARSGLKLLHLAGRRLLPIVQGGMGVGVSAHRLAGTVAQQGGVGTISSVDLRRHHPDLMDATRGLHGEAAKARIDAANVEALGREIRAARALSGGHGMLAVNVMRAISAYASHVKTALEGGIDAVVVGAGLPLDLPDLAREHPKAALIPILSDARGVHLLLRKWERKQRMPDAIVLEHPGWAGGHLGAARIEDTHDARFEFERVVPETLDVLHRAGLADTVPLIVAGGLRSNEDIRRMQLLGAGAAQFGTAFAVTEECDADDTFKRVLAGASEDDLVEFTSVAGLPARAVRTPWLQKYLSLIERTQAAAHPKSRCAKHFDCLAQCGLRDGLKGWGQFCIDHQLAAAMRGDVRTGLFFRGRGALPFGDQIRSVRSLFDHLLTPVCATA